MKSEHKNRWLPPMYFGVLFATVLAFLSGATSAAEAGDSSATEPIVERQVLLVGYIENQEFSDIADQIRNEYLSHSFVPDEGRDMALAIITYIGPDVVSNNRFVPPENNDMSPDELEYMTGRYFPDEGCRIERLRFPSEGEYYVLLVDASDHPSAEYIEECLLLATLTALGERLDGREVQPVHVLRNWIRGIVGEPA